MEVTAHYAPIIEVIEQEYEIPQLKRKRRISALLPSDYHQTDKHYPVLYLKDGQNLFDDNAPFGNWAIDRSLENLAKEGLNDVIVIAIDHGGNDRITEYLPYFNARVGKGEGELYIRFMRETLMPYVNKKYRTMSDRANTGIGGSSMGGLISLFAGLNHQDMFSKLMVFSPSLWIAPRIFQQAANFNPSLATSIYIYAGGKESANHIPNITRFKNALLDGDKDYSKIRLHVSLNPEGTHSENHWREEFPKALKWLYYAS
jgi:predicted alpha/beta superfamily hydrolase